MNATGWKRKIKKCCNDAGTYKPFFDPVIDTLAEILERRDTTSALFVEKGGQPVVKHTNKGGAVNIEQNPMLRLVNDLNRDALSYWKELGLTPASLKRMNEAALSQKTKKSPLEEALAKIGGA